jgi:multiple sugar transport system permease protein
MTDVIRTGPGTTLAPRAPAPRRKRLTATRREALAGYLFISPWIIGFLVFTLGAMVYSLVISFSRYNLATNRAKPVGLRNYRLLIEDPSVVKSLQNTLFYAIMAVPLEVAFALFLAVLLNQVGRGAGFFRTAFYRRRWRPPRSSCCSSTATPARSTRSSGSSASRGRSGSSNPPG